MDFDDYLRRIRAIVNAVAAVVRVCGDDASRREMAAIRDTIETMPARGVNASSSPAAMVRLVGDVDTTLAEAQAVLSRVRGA